VTLPWPCPGRGPGGRRGPPVKSALTLVATRGYLGSMRAVAVKDLKNRLSAYLREVAQGETILVTDRGRVVAELRRPTVEALASPSEQALARLHGEGVLIPGLPQDPDAYGPSRARLKGDSSTLLDAERAER